MIKLTGINKIYRTNEIETLALENVNLDVAKGEFVSIMGPSGCGKYTLLNIMVLYTMKFFVWSLPQQRVNMLSPLL